MENLFKKIFQNNLEFGKAVFLVGLFLLPSAISISIVFLLISLIISFWNDTNKIFKDKINLFFFTSCLFLLFSGFFNFFDNNSINNLSNNKSLTLIGLLNWIPLIFAFVGFQKYLLDNIDRKRCTLALIFGSIPVIFSCFSQFIFNWFGPMETLYGLIIWYQRPIDGITGITGLFNNPNYLASWLSLIWPFSLSFMFFDNENKIKLIFKILLAFSISLLLILTASRAGWLCLLIPLFFIYSSRFKIFLISFFSGISLITVFLSSSIFGLQFKNFILKIIPKGIRINFTNLGYENLDISRFGIWKYAVKMISEKPIFGYGSNSFSSLFLNETGFWKGHTHNLPLELMINYGLPTALLILLPTTYLIYRAYLNLFFMKIPINKNTILDQAWLLSFTLLVLMHLVDIQYFDGRISIAGWILLSGIRNIVFENKILNDKKISKI